MASTLLKVKHVTASSHSAQYRPELVLEDNPEDSSSRWTGEYHRSSPNIRNSSEWLKLELRDLSIVKTITFGKFSAAHPCNIDQFKVYGSTDDMDDMTLLLQSSLKNDEIPQTFALKHITPDGIEFPCRYIKIVPITPFNQTYNMSIWHVALRGVNSPDVVQRAYQDYNNVRESAAMRLILKHLRRKNSSAYQVLLEETGIQIENPLISELYEAFVVQGDHARAEILLASCVDTGLIDLRLQNPHARPTTTWKRIWDTSSDGIVPSPRGGHVSVLDSARGIMYLFGGWDGQQDLDDLWAYSIPTGRWVRLSANVKDEDGPTARSCGAAVFDPATGDIYFLGRYVAKGSVRKAHPQVVAGEGRAGEDPVLAAYGIESLGQRISMTTRGLVERPATPSASQSVIRPSSTEGPPRSDFYRYSTRGPNEGKWECLSDDTAVQGGIELTHDLAIAIDSEAQIIYAFGGELYKRGRDSYRRYGSFCSYDIKRKSWTKSFSDPPSPPVPSSHTTHPTHRTIPSRSRHSMVFDSFTKRIYVVGGERAGTTFDTIWTYDTNTGQVSEMFLPLAVPRPGAVQMHNATLDPTTREIFTISELATAPQAHPRSPDPEAQSSIVTLWIYSMDDNTWSPILEPARHNNITTVSRPSAPGTVDEAKEPRPRLGHSVVYDPSRRTFYTFGGNGGSDTRLNDFWSLTLNRFTVDDVIRKGKLQIRSQKFKEMCETESSVTALQYLQSEVSTVVNHQDETESASFQRLLSFLLSRPISPIAPLSPHPTDNNNLITKTEADVEMHDAEGGPSGGAHHYADSDAFPLSMKHASRGDGAGKGRGRDRKDELHEQRLAAFDKLLDFIDPRAKQPKADIVDLVRSELS